MTVAIGGCAQGLPALEQAMQMLDTLAISEPEGIWEYPGEYTRVLISRDRSSTDRTYTLQVVESLDEALACGTFLGRLKPTAKERQYELVQYTRKKKNILDLPSRCMVSLSSDGRTLMIEPGGKLSLRFTPGMLLPKFWRAVRIGIKESDRNTEGLRKLYPSGDGRGILYQQKRYL